MYSQLFDLTTIYFLVAGIASVNSHVATTGSVTFARFEVQVALQYEFDIRDIGTNFTTGYIPYGSKVPGEYSKDIYGTEVFEVNDALRSIVSRVSAPTNLHQSIPCSQLFFRTGHLARKDSGFE